MQTSLIIVDDFYNNPEEVREHALQQDFGVSGNYPGRRTKTMINDSIKETISNLLRPHAGEVTNWNDENGGYTGAYQYTLASDRSWVHHDNTTSWAGVCYLTPNPPLSAGTALYRHIETQCVRNPTDEQLSEYVDSHGQDLTKWEVTDKISNVYNRLILYRGDYYHMSQDYFGSTLNNGRLFQTFFITTER